MRRAAAGYKSHGLVLIAVLAAVMTLAVLLVGFTQTTRTSLAQADGFYRTEQAWNGAWGGLQIAVALVRDANTVAADPQTAKLLTTEQVVSVGEAQCSIVITGENGLFNVNRLIGADGQPDRQRVDQLLRLIDLLNQQRKDLPPIGYGLVPALIDWIDDDSNLTHLAFVQQDNLGAENDYYQTLRPSYPCRNNPVDTVEELLSVKGMTPESFRRLQPYLTCVGDGKIDLNAAPKLILQSLSEQMDATLADRIVRQRTLKPFKSLSELRSIPGMTDTVSSALMSLATVTPTQRFYRVRSQATVQDHRSTIEVRLQTNPDTGTVDISEYREPWSGIRDPGHESLR